MTRRTYGRGPDSGRGGRVLVMLACLLGSLAPLGAGPAAAAPKPVPAPQAPPEHDFGLSVSPTRLAIAPDEINGEHRFTVTNRGRQPLDLVVSHSGFTADTEGRVRFQREEAPYSAMDWITVTPTRFRLEPGTRQDVLARITMPPDPEPGDHHVALRFMVPAPAEGGQIRLNRGISTPMYITVPGPVDDTVRITRLESPSFATGGPIRISATFQNTGTVHRDFRGDNGRLHLSIDGRKVPFPDFTVPRGATRNVSVQWDGPPAMCLCRAEVSFPLKSGVLEHADTSVMILPVARAAWALAGVVAVVLLGMFARRQYRARVLAAARMLREHEGSHAAEKGADSVDVPAQGSDLAGDLLGGDRDDGRDRPGH